MSKTNQDLIRTWVEAGFTRFELGNYTLRKESDVFWGIFWTSDDRRLRHLSVDYSCDPYFILHWIHAWAEEQCWKNGIGIRSNPHGDYWAMDWPSEDITNKRYKTKNEVLLSAMLAMRNKENKSCEK